MLLFYASCPNIPFFSLLHKRGRKPEIRKKQQSFFSGKLKKIDNAFVYYTKTH